MPHTDLSAILSEATLRLQDLTENEKKHPHDFLSALGSNLDIIAKDDVAIDAALHLYKVAAHTIPAKVLEALIDFSAVLPTDKQKKLIELIDDIATPRVIHDMVMNGSHYFPTFRDINALATQHLLKNHIGFAPENLSVGNISVFRKIATVVGQSIDSHYSQYRLKSLEDASARILMAIVKNDIRDSGLDGLMQRREAFAALLQHDFDAIINDVDPNFAQTYAPAMLKDMMAGPFDSIYKLSDKFTETVRGVTDSRIFAPAILDLYADTFKRARAMRLNILDFNGTRAAAEFAHHVAFNSYGQYMVKKMAFEDYRRLAPRKPTSKLRYEDGSGSVEYELAQFGVSLARSNGGSKYLEEGANLVLLAAQQARARYAEKDANNLIRGIFSLVAGSDDELQDTRVCLLEIRFSKELGVIDLDQGLKRTEKLPESETKQLISRMRGFLNIEFRADKLDAVITDLLLKRAENDLQRLDVLTFMDRDLNDLQKMALSDVFRHVVAIDPNSAMDALNTASHIAKAYYMSERRMPKYYRSMLTDMIKSATRLSPENQRAFSLWTSRNDLTRSIYDLDNSTLSALKAFNDAVKPQVNANHPAFQITAAPKSAKFINDIS